MKAALDESVLESADRLAEADREGLLRAVATAGAQLRESLTLTAEADLPGHLADLRPRAVLLAADPPAEDAAFALAALAAGPGAAAPVVRLDGPALPVWAGATDTLLAVTHSSTGRAVAVLADAAARRGLTVLGAGAVDSPLQEACGRNRAPYVGLPPGRHPRAAFWGLLAPLLVAAGELGLLTDTEEDLADVADLLDALAERSRPTGETFGNPAKSLALDVGESLPVAWGTSAPTGAATRRLAGQLAGIAGHPALWGTLPGAVYRLGGVLAGGVPGADDIFRDRVEEAGTIGPRLLLVRDADEAVDVRRLVEQLVADAIRRGVPVTELAADETAGPVGRLASLVGLLDFTAVYVGLASRGASGAADSGGGASGGGAAFGGEGLDSTDGGTTDLGGER
ncbi:MAG TPA: SIS domain-containing protein [Mycobacteriales bacterium]|nr:SIS domain-containing protein [Mycobacteriales bacterium]